MSFFLAFLIFFCSLFVMANDQNHILMMMLATEMLSVGIYGMLILSLYHSCSMGFCLGFLSFSVCKAVLGLGLYASIVQGFGVEKAPSLLVLKY
uniref:NADH dehydrogenase subunit 4L n=1 Tax=Acanthocardia tuberculata TaxID=385555 RepID=Q06SA9_ACATU|nr:NADH dehydrogenase subunit 4L [Acanthocardia tuberculata]ABF60129.1 NADH dehydrogenase subunit 4L [Acanthocardia tuberculata]